MFVLNGTEGGFKGVHYYYQRFILFTKKLWIIILLSIHYAEINKLFQQRFYSLLVSVVLFQFIQTFYSLSYQVYFFPCFIFNFASLERFRTRLRNLCTKNKIMMKLGLSWVNSAYLGLKLIGLTLLIQNINLEGDVGEGETELTHQCLVSKDVQCRISM